MSIKLIFSSLAIVLTFVAYVPYIFSILTKETRPHVFSWIIWGLTTFIVFLAQLEEKGGLGAWPIGVSGVITLFIALLALIKKTDITITPMDWVFFIMALASLPLWYFTENPLWSVIILTTVDTLGFGPTIRKAYSSPYEESTSFFLWFVLRNVLAIMALEHYSTTTVLFPLVVSIASVLLVLLIYHRRKVLAV